MAAIQQPDIRTFVGKLQQNSFPLPWPGHFVGGRWQAGAKALPTKPSINPNCGQPIIEVSTDKDVINQAIDSAYGARGEFAAVALEKRLEILSRFRQLLADFSDGVRQSLRVEAGKPLWEATKDIEAALRYLESIVSKGEEITKGLLAPAELGQGNGKFSLLPIGVTAAYIPFSTPITSFTIYFSAAMIAGCPLIVNSSTHASLSATLYALMVEQLELKPGVVSFIFGNFNAFKQVLNNKKVAALLYTGSSEHCETIRREIKSQPGRQAVLQSGGKNAVIVHSSADLDYAVKCVLYGALKSGGQRCTSTSRVFVYRSLSEAFCEQLTEAYKTVKIGRTDMDSDPFMGPLYSEKAVEKFLRFQTMANREAEKTLLWGKTIENDSGGFFVTPGLHYMSKFDNSSAYQGNVLFSPDVAIYDYDVLETAIEQINTTDAAFAVSFIGEPSVLEKRRQLFLAPNLLVNRPTVEIEATLPLAGRLQSGHHRFHGPGIALYLCYPQVLEVTEDPSEFLRTWP
jgi:acyl-CoA reductase-like NAD-dependent aldehyde dehydrogenase